MAEVVGKAYQALPPEERKRAAVFGWNFGDAAAIDFFGAPYGLPPAISGHENYFLWGLAERTAAWSSSSAGRANASSRCFGASSRSASSIIRSPCPTSGIRRCGSAAT